MDEQKQQLCGSKRNDLFKLRHKELPYPGLYCSDIDLAFIRKYPSGVYGWIDVKGLDETVTFAQAVLFEALQQIAPVYLVRDESGDAIGPFHVSEFESADLRVDPVRVKDEPICVCNTWSEFESWELSVRQRPRSHYACTMSRIEARVTKLRR